MVLLTFLIALLLCRTCIGSETRNRSLRERPAQIPSILDRAGEHDIADHANEEGIEDIRPQAPEWWDRISSEFKGVNLRRCRFQMRKNVFRRHRKPKTGQRCGKIRKTCYFGTQQCPNVGAHPKTECFCAGEEGGKVWICSKEACPEPPSLPDDTANQSENITKPNILETYQNVDELCNDFNQTVRLLVDAEIDYQSIRLDELDRSLEAAADSDSEDSGLGANGGLLDHQQTTVAKIHHATSDGLYVYAAYEKNLVVWRTENGEIVANETFPVVILDLHLVSGRLVLFCDLPRQPFPVRFGYNYLTRVMVLDTTILPTSMDLLLQRDIQGAYKRAFSVGADIYLVTTSIINYDSILDSVDHRHSNFSQMNRTEYKKAASVIAEPLIQDFLQRLKNDIIDLGVASSIPKVSLWHTELGGTKDNTLEQVFKHGITQTCVQVSSFSMVALDGPGKVSAAFMPSSSSIVSIAPGFLVLTSRDWLEAKLFYDLGTRLTTYFAGFALDGGTAAPSFLGSVPGHIKHEPSIFDGHLQVAARTEFDDYDLTKDNYTISILKIPEAGEDRLLEVARIPNIPSIDTIQFLGQFAYIFALSQESFQLYRFDFDTRKGTLDIPISRGGEDFAVYHPCTHPISEDKKGLVLSVGPASMSLLDFSNATMPQHIHEYFHEKNNDETFYSDPKALQWVTRGDGRGTLILPVRIAPRREFNSYHKNRALYYFDGYMAYDVSRKEGFRYRWNVSHVDLEQHSFCTDQRNLPKGSFLSPTGADGGTVVTTLKGRTVLAVDLDTREQQWNLTMPKPPCPCRFCCSTHLCSS